MYVIMIMTSIDIINFLNQDEEYHGVDFWDLFGNGKKVLEHKLKELKGKKEDYPSDIEASLGAFDFIMDALEGLSEEYIEVLIDNLCDCQRAIDSNVVIARELIAPLLGPQDVIVLNSRHAASSELYCKEPSKLRVASAVSTWRGLGIGKCNTDIISPLLLNRTNMIMIKARDDIRACWPAKSLCHLFNFHIHTNKLLTLNYIYMY